MCGGGVVKQLLVSSIKRPDDRLKELLQELRCETIIRLISVSGVSVEQTCCCGTPREEDLMQKVSQGV